MKKGLAILLLAVASMARAQQQLPLLKVSPNGRFFQTANGQPFFWLGDTGWLLFVKCNREEAIHYLQTRKEQGFNVVQVMVLHDVNNKNAYGDYALKNANVATPNTTPGNDFTDTVAYDYWDHVDFIVDEAAKRGIYIGLVTVWGSNVKNGKVNLSNAEAYAKFLASRFKDRNNIIWINGGDIPGDEGMAVWKKIGNTIKKYDKRHLVTFHPRGRYSSTDWFHQEPWLDFNMFQSGHKDYAQDTSSKEKHHYGEDNWKFVNADYKFSPGKPTLDGEPSYENIPHGLHDSLQPRWTAADLRRYEYWSVFAGAAGFTYGENAIMQFHKVSDGSGSFGVNQSWTETIHAPGAGQMQHLKRLLLSSKSYFDRVPAQEIIVDNGSRYDYLLATKGKKFAMVYTYTGRSFSLDLSKLDFTVTRLTWFNPAEGTGQSWEGAGEKKIQEFNPPGEPREGNDWVLILEKP